jgi:hypothetical protein
MRNFYLRWWCGSEPILGIEVRDDVVLCAQSATGAAQEEPFKRFSIPLPSGVVGSGRIKDPHRLASILKESRHVSQVVGGRCAVAIPSDASFTAHLAVPDEVVCMNQRDVYEWALERLSLDASHVHGKVYLEDDALGMGPQLLVVAVRRSVKEMMEDILKVVGLELSCLTLRSIALHKAAAIVSQHARKSVTLWVDLTDRSPELHLFEGEALRFSRCLNERLLGVTELSVSHVCDELRKLDVSRYSSGEVAILCAGPETIVRTFHKAWKDAAPFMSGHGSSGDSGALLTAEPYLDPYFIASGLAELLRSEL